MTSLGDLRIFESKEGRGSYNLLLLVLESEYDINNNHVKIYIFKYDSIINWVTRDDKYNLIMNSLFKFMFGFNLLTFTVKF